MLGLIFDKGEVSIEIQDLSFYTCPLDGRMIKAVVGTKCGRIFMGGLDGIIFELVYSTGAGILWSNPLCRKVFL